MANKIDYDLLEQAYLKAAQGQFEPNLFILNRYGGSKPEEIDEFLEWATEIRSKSIKLRLRSWIRSLLNGKRNSMDD